MIECSEVVRDLGALRYEEIDGRDTKKCSNLKAPVVVDELSEVELRHPKDCSTMHGRMDEITLHASDVCSWNVGKRPVLKGESWVLGSLAADKVAMAVTDSKGISYHICLCDNDA